VFIDIQLIIFLYGELSVSNFVFIYFRTQTSWMSMWQCTLHKAYSVSLNYGLKGNYRENLTYWNKLHTWTYKQNKIHGEPILTDRHKKVNYNHFYNSTQNILFDTLLVPVTSLVPRAAENNIGRIGVWSISMRIWSSIMPECFGTGFSNHQGTLGITLHCLPKY